MAAVYTDANFETEVINADRLTVVDFWAPWCGPCLALGPTIDALSTEYDGKVNVGKVNVDENPNLSINFGVTNIPCVLFIKGGQVVDKQVGAAPKSAFVKKIEQHL
jgi:thioredoxin 1